MYSNEIWQVEVEPSARRALKRLQKSDHVRIVEAIRTLVHDPYSGDVQKLGGTEDSWRRRVGSYRIFFEVSQSSRRVDVYKIERRGSNTY